MIFIVVNSLVTIFFIFLFCIGIRLKIYTLIPVNAAGFTVSATAIILELLGLENKITTLIFMILLIVLLIMDFLISFRDIPEHAFHENALNIRFNNFYDRDYISYDSYKIIGRESIILDEMRQRNGYDEKAKALALKSWRWGNQHFLEGNYDEAFKRYQISFNNIPTSVASLNQSGILIQLNEFQQALVSCDQALEINPELYEAWINKSIAYERMSQLDEAMTCLENAEQLMPNSNELWFLKGNMFLKQAKFEDAYACYDAAINITPDYLEAWYNKGLCLNKIGKTQEAFHCFDIVVGLNPEHYQALFNRGNALNRLDRNEEAVMSYNQAIKLKPDYNEALNNRGIALYKLGRVGDALKSYVKALKIKSDYYEAWLNQGLLLDNLAHYEKAIYSYQKFIDCAPGNLRQHVDTTRNRIEELQKYLAEEKIFLEPKKNLNRLKSVTENLKSTELMN